GPWRNPPAPLIRSHACAVQVFPARSPYRETGWPVSLLAPPEREKPRAARRLLAPPPLPPEIVPVILANAATPIDAGFPSFPSWFPLLLASDSSLLLPVSRGRRSRRRLPDLLSARSNGTYKLGVKWIFRINQADEPPQEQPVHGQQ